MNKKGFALIGVIVAFILISLMTLYLTNLISFENSLLTDKYKSIKAFYYTQGGLEYILKKRKFPDYYTIDQPIGDGLFSVYTSNYTGDSIKVLVKGKYEGYERYLQATFSTSKTANSYLKKGTFLKRAGTGFQSITSVGFQPKAIIFYWTRQTTNNFSPNVNAGFGMATSSTNQSAVSVTMIDNSGRSDQGRRYSNSNCIIFLTGGGPPTLDSQATFVGFSLKGFTLNWTTSSANQYIIHYIALGGNIQAKVGNFTLTTISGTQSVTGVGFQPDFILFNWSYGTALNSNIARSQLGIGFAKNSSEQVSFTQAGSDNIGLNTDKRWWQRTDSCILSLTTTNPPAQDARVSFVSMDADGFTVNKIDPPAVQHTIFYLAIKGGQHKVGFFNQPAVNGSQSIIDVGFSPNLLLFTSYNLLANTSEQSNGGVSIGACANLSQSSIWYQDRNVDPSDANMYNINNKVISLAFASALTGQAELTAFTANGFNLNWTNCDGTTRQILYWAYKPPSEIVEVKNLTEVFY